MANMNRRQFVKLGTAADMGALAAGAAEHGPGQLPAPPPHPFRAAPMDIVRIGFVGVGRQGSSHVRNLLKIKGARITAVCDIAGDKVRAMQDLVEAAGQPRPTGYARGERDFVRLCETEDLDLVYTATPWRWHVPVCLAAMKNGKHAATEVPAALTLEDCWALVETAERLEKHCVMMENCCYGRNELMTLNMVRQGVLGEPVHAECGYLHDLRALHFLQDRGDWWRPNLMHMNGSLYTTHGLGPVAQYLDINRGNRFTHLVSMSSASMGLQQWRDENLPPDDPRRKEEYVLGDVNTCLIKTARGQTVRVVYNVTLPRPYSRINLLQGTRGLVRGWPDGVYIEGRTEGHAFEPLDAYYEEFDHPLWKGMQERAQGAGHGGMDFIEDYRLIACLRAGQPTDMDVYDAAAWSAPIALSQRSVAQRGAPVEFPDFTRGQWKTNKPIGIIEA